MTTSTTPATFPPGTLGAVLSPAMIEAIDDEILALPQDEPLAIKVALAATSAEHLISCLDDFTRTHHEAGIRHAVALMADVAFES